MKTSNNYRVSGKKMTSRFGVSQKQTRDAVKQGLVGSALEAKYYGRDPRFSATEWSRRQRMSNRQRLVYERGLPLFDMDGSYYHE